MHAAQVIAVVAHHMEASPGVIEQRMRALLGNEPEPLSPQVCPYASQLGTCICILCARRWCKPAVPAAGEPIVCVFDQCLVRCSTTLGINLAQWHMLCCLAQPG